MHRQAPKSKELQALNGYTIYKDVIIYHSIVSFFHLCVELLPLGTTLFLFARKLSFSSLHIPLSLTLLSMSLASCPLSFDWSLQRLFLLSDY